MTTSIERDRLRDFVDLILGSLDEDVDGSAIARQAHLSRYHFDRIVAAALGESPGAFRRRLLLERAAWRLGRHTATVTEAALDAGYASLEGFERAFHRSFGIQPGRFGSAGRSFVLPASNTIHFHPPGGLFVPASTRSQERTMDLTDRLLEHDLWFTGRMLDKAAELSDEALDRPVWDNWQRMAFDSDKPTVRSMLERLVATKENWVAAANGRPALDDRDTSIDGLRQRWIVATAEFAELTRVIRRDSSWDAGFVDALCDPPESFTFGGMLAHIVTFSAYRRQVLVKALHDVGALDVGIGDPVEWERSLA